jgi:hypothetical protein
VLEILHPSTMQECCRWLVLPKPYVSRQKRRVLQAQLARATDHGSSSTKIPRRYYRTLWSTSNTLNLYSSGAGFEYRPGNRLARLGFPRPSSLSPGNIRDTLGSCLRYTSSSSIVNPKPTETALGKARLSVGSLY